MKKSLRLLSLMLPLINFQSILLDEGGNLLPTGATTIQFQILDENRQSIYSESQSVDVTKGAVSALIGNGTDAKGITTGGIPDDIFATGAPRYLQVQVSGHTAEDPMTIVPVPYAQWSQTCATVADKTVGLNQLAPDVVEKFAKSLSTSNGAAEVGVSAKFINSGSSSVQGVLQDIDLTVKKGQETDQFLTGKLNQEVTERTNTVKAVDDKITAETATRAAADNAFAQSLSNMNVSLQSAVTQTYVDTKSLTLQNQVTNHEGRIQLLENKPDPAANQYIPPSNMALLKSGSYQTGSDFTVNAGFKPTAIKIFSADSKIEFFGVASNPSTITGITTNNSGLAGVPSIQLSGTSVSIPTSNGNVNLLNFGANKTYYYVIWGTN